jgi:uncharacterized membrane protein
VDDDREEVDGDRERAESNPWIRTRWRREGFGLEFDRVANFADAIYAIALTLIVVGIEVPQLRDESSGSELLEQLGDLLPSIITFFIVFFVVGNYWMAHHRFISWLAEIDSRQMVIQLAYLSIIAFLPFPAALLGTLDDNPVALASFALAMAAASGLETAGIVHAHHAGLMKRRLSDAAFRFEWRISTVPVLVFLVSIPFAFASTWIALAVWFVNVPIGIAMNRKRPPEFRPDRAHS